MGREASENNNEGNSFESRILKGVAMWTQFLSKQNKFLCLSAFIMLALPTSEVFAYQPNINRHGAVAQDLDTTNNPLGVCVFDLDKTLIKESDVGYNNNKNDLFPQARAAVQKCVDAKFGIAFLTARDEKFNRGANVPYAFTVVGPNDEPRVLSDDYYKKIVENNAYGSYEGVRPIVEYKKDAAVLPGQRKKFNPLYISYSRPYIKKTVGGIEYKTILNDKGDGMNRFMRTFYGHGVAEADDTDLENAYAQQYPVLDKEGKKRLSGCLVLFDDTQYNIDEVKAFNTMHDLNFQVVKVDPTQGVLLSQVETAITDLAQTCKKDQQPYTVYSRKR